jgi:hypothetical protein
VVAGLNPVSQTLRETGHRDAIVVVGVDVSAASRRLTKTIVDLDEGGIVLRSLPEGIDAELITVSQVTTIWVIAGLPGPCVEGWTGSRGDRGRRFYFQCRVEGAPLVR